MKMKVTLKKPHKHAGESYPVGAKIDVEVHEALWLKGADVITDGLDSIKAEAKKLATPQNPAPYADLIEQATAAEADRKKAQSADAPAQETK